MKNSFFTIFNTFLILAIASLNLVAQGSVSFVIKNAGFNVDGKFDKVETEVVYDSKNPQKSKFFGSVETASVNTDNGKRDKHLREKDYFFCESYPIMKFESTSVKKVSDVQLSVTGKLTIRDVTKVITIPVDISNINGKDIFVSNFKLNRRDYNVGGWSLILSNDLKVTIKYSN